MKALILKFKGWERSGNKVWRLLAPSWCWQSAEKGRLFSHSRSSGFIIWRGLKRRSSPETRKGVTRSHLEHCFSWRHLFFNSDLSSLTRRRCRQGHKRLFSLRDTPTGLLANGETNRRRWLRPSWCGEYQSTYVWLPEAAWARVCNRAAHQHHI